MRNVLAHLQCFHVTLKLGSTVGSHRQKKKQPFPRVVCTSVEMGDNNKDILSRHSRKSLICGAEISWFVTEDKTCRPEMFLPIHEGMTGSCEQMLWLHSDVCVGDGGWVLVVWAQTLSVSPKGLVLGSVECLVTLSLSRNARKGSLVSPPGHSSCRSCRHGDLWTQVPQQRGSLCDSAPSGVCEC